MLLAPLGVFLKRITGSNTLRVESSQIARSPGDLIDCFDTIDVYPTFGLVLDIGDDTVHGIILEVWGSQELAEHPFSLSTHLRRKSFSKVKLARVQITQELSENGTVELGEKNLVISVGVEKNVAQVFGVEYEQVLVSSKGPLLFSNKELNHIAPLYDPL